MSGARARTSRRRFIGATGIALSAPLAGLGAEVVDAATGTRPSPDDLDAIRALMHEHATQLNARPDGFGSPERIDIAANGRSATRPAVIEGTCVRRDGAWRIHTTRVTTAAGA